MELNECVDIYLKRNNCALVMTEAPVAGTGSIAGVSSTCWPDSSCRHDALCRFMHERLCYVPANFGCGDGFDFLSKFEATDFISNVTTIKYARNIRQGYSRDAPDVIP